MTRPCNLLILVLSFFYISHSLPMEQKQERAFFNMFESLNLNEKEVENYQSMLNEYRNQLQDKLENSAFRRGTSTGIQGITRRAPSDHSPITINFNGILAGSWNLLSEEHLGSVEFLA